MGDPNQTSIPVETGSATVEEVLEHEDVETVEEISFDEEDEPMVDEGAYAEDVDEIEY